MGDSDFRRGVHPLIRSSVTSLITVTAGNDVRGMRYELGMDFTNHGLHT
ncbi:hypothetical protein H7J50_04170 [Mycobacterium intermedium]|nr:hypothetical protein [Mycobacterium intermedium]MCV6963006.1 hypothetical protein [Mycobacterium intermedium]